MTRRTLSVDYLARVEGEAALSLTIRDGVVTDAKLKIFEPPRFFEDLLRGRDCSDALDITARICGICPVAYQMTATHAIERAAGVRADGPLRDLRRLLYCGEWIESHALHVFMLHAPDFLGFQDAVSMAKDHAEVVKTGLRIKKAGNAIVSLIGGREIHPVNVRLGGVYRAPLRRELASLRDDLERARDDARALVDWTAGLAFPHVEMDYEYVALHHPDEYPMNEGRIVSTGGLDVDAAAFETHIQERHALHSTALHATMAARGAYVVGPMARFHVNRARLTPQAREAAAAAGLSDGCFNPFKSIIVRAVEILFAFEEALRLIDAYEPPDPPHIPVVARACTGQAATEAPRGLLFHRYDIDADGRIAAARIVPPTSQNQKVMEQDLKAVAERFIDLPDDALQWRCEQAIRNYDPCISCATHFLKVVVDRGTVLDP